MDLVDFRKGSQFLPSKTTTGNVEQKVTIDLSVKGNRNGYWDDIARGPLHWLKYNQ